MNKDSIRVIDEANINPSNYSLEGACCVVLTHDNKLLMQYRPMEWRTFPDCLTTFGGQIEEGESPVEGLIRELNEELGALVKPEELSKLGVITEKITQHTELVYVYFWHDKNNTITGCYEAEARYFNNVDEVLSHPRVMDYVRWSLKEAQKQRLLL